MKTKPNRVRIEVVLEYDAMLCEHEGKDKMRAERELLRSTLSDFGFNQVFKKLEVKIVKKAQ